MFLFSWELEGEVGLQTEGGKYLILLGKNSQKAANTWAFLSAQWEAG